jgi:O-antigen/teichoic acid export membrane protein
MVDMAEASNSTRLLGNSAWNAAAFVVGAGLNLLVLPFVVYRLGVATFGMAGLVTACVAPALIFSNALGLSTSRELAQRLAAEQRSDARHFFASAMLLAVAIGSLIVMVLALAGPPFARLAFKFTGDTAQDLDLAFAFGSGGWFCQCLSSVLLSMFTARQDYARISSISIFSAVVTTLAILIFVPQRPIASTFLACQASGFLATLIAALVLARRLFNGWLAVPAFHRDPTAQLVRFGAWQLAAQGGALIAGQADRYLLGALLPPQFVGFYVIAQRLEEAVYIGILKVGEILFPFFSVLQKEASDRKADLLFRSSWVLNLLAAGALGGIIPVAGPLLHLWTGAEVAVQAQQVLVMLSIAGILGCSVNVFAFYLLANGQSRLNALIAMVTAIFTLATSALALPYFGWQAAGWSACAGMVAQLFTTVCLLRRSFDRTRVWSRVTHFVVVPLLTGIVTALLLRHSVNESLFEHAPHWWFVGGLYSLTAAIIFVAVVIASQIGPHRTACRRDLQSIVHRFSPMRAR